MFPIMHIYDLETLHAYTQLCQWHKDGTAGPEFGAGCWAVHPTSDVMDTL